MWIAASTRPWAVSGLKQGEQFSLPHVGGAHQRLDGLPRTVSVQIGARDSALDSSVALAHLVQDCLFDIHFSLRSETIQISVCRLFGEYLP